MGRFILAFIVFLLVFIYVNMPFDYLRRHLKLLSRNVLFRNNKLLGFFRLITPDTERGLLLLLLRLLRVSVLLLFLYLYLPFLFSQISYTRGFGETLMTDVLTPVKYVGSSLLTFLPKLIIIIVIITVVNYLIKGLGHIAQQIKSEKLSFAGFYPDWAVPTFNLARVMVIIFAMIMIFPYLLGSGSDAFKGVSVFVGLLLSLGSAGAISNMISGVIITYMRPFKLGDRVLPKMKRSQFLMLHY